METMWDGGDGGGGGGGGDFECHFMLCFLGR